MSMPQGTTFNPTITTLHPVAPATKRGSTTPSVTTVAGPELQNFGDLGAKLVRVPKTELDEKRQGSE